MSTDPTVEELQSRLAELESETAALAAQLSGEPAAKTGRRGRAVLATVLIVLGSLLAPVAIVSSWTKVVISDTDAVVATLAPLAKDPRVQAYVGDQVISAIERQIDIDGLVGQVFDGLAGAIQGQPQAQGALRILQQPAAAGIRSVIDNAVTQVVSSEAFVQAWQESLRVSHGQAIAVLQGDPEAALTATSAGLGLRLAPVIERVKAALSDRGFLLADRIPVIDRTIVLVPTESLVHAQLAYRAAVLAGVWLALAVVVLLAGGVLAATRRIRAAVWASVGLGLGAGSVLAGVAIGRIIAQLTIPVTTVPNDVLQLFYDTATAGLNELATTTLLLAAIVGVTAWLAGPFAPAQWLRSGYLRVVASLRQWADARGVSTGGLGRWIHSYRVALWAVIGVLSAITMAVNRPITGGLVLQVAVVALLSLLVISLLERPAPDVPDVSGV